MASVLDKQFEQKQPLTCYLGRRWFTAGSHPLDPKPSRSVDRADSCPPQTRTPSSLAIKGPSDAVQGKVFAPYQRGNVIAQSKHPCSEDCLGDRGHPKLGQPGRQPHTLCRSHCGRNDNICICAPFFDNHPWVKGCRAESSPIVAEVGRCSRAGTSCWVYH